LGRLLALASRWDLPVALHAPHGAAVGALEALKRHQIERAVFHWHKAPAEVTRAIVDAGYLISVSPEVVYRERDREMVAAVPLDEEFARAGLALARFDFRGCGESSGKEDETTVATRIEDARAVLNHLDAHPRLDRRFGLLGSSLGGFVALHLAAERTDAAAVVTWNAPASLEDLGDDVARDAAIGTPFLLELASHRYDTSPAGVARHLAIHCDADD